MRRDDLGILLHHLLKKLRPAHPRHAHVGDDHVERLLLHHRQRLLRARGKLDIPAILIALENESVHFKKHGLIIYKKNALLHKAEGGFGEISGMS